MDGKIPAGKSVIFDDDHYYMASILAELLCAKEIPVVLVTTEDRVSSWSQYTYARELDCEIDCDHPLKHDRLFE